MIERLGNVVYWLGLIVAAAFVVAAVFMLPGLEGGVILANLIGATISYLIGRAFRYVLSGY